MTAIPHSSRPNSCAGCQRNWGEDCRFVIFSHNSLVNDFGRRGVGYREEARRRLKGYRAPCCLNGHDHGDDCRVVDGIPYVTVHSASCAWAEERWLDREALHALMEIDEWQMRICSMQGSYQSGVPEQSRWNGVRIGPESRIEFGRVTKQPLSLRTAAALLAERISCASNGARRSNAAAR